MERTNKMKIESKRKKNKRYYNKHKKEILRKQSIYQKEKRKDIALSEDELSRINRDKLGRFKTTNGNQRYKRCNVNGVNKQKHVVIWENYHKRKVPDGHIIHHRDEDKMNNDIKNLELKELSKHTRDHFKKYYQNRSVWNKGIKYKNPKLLGHKVTKRQILKGKAKWFNKELNTNIEIWKLRDHGLSNIKIGKILNLTPNNVCQRWLSLSKTIDTRSGRLK